jgi:hypothetical protein
MGQLLWTPASAGVTRWEGRAVQTKPIGQRLPGGRGIAPFQYSTIPSVPIAHRGRLYKQSQLAPDGCTNEPNPWASHCAKQSQSAAGRMNDKCCGEKGL